MSKAATLQLLVFLTAVLVSRGRAEPLKPIHLPSSAHATSQEGPTEKADPPADPPPKSPIEVDKKNMRISIKGRFTGTVGVVELGACTNRGKTFLAVLVLDAQPSRIAEAMKTLGIEPGEVPVVDRQNATATVPKGR